MGLSSLLLDRGVRDALAQAWSVSQFVCMFSDTRKDGRGSSSFPASKKERCSVPLDLRTQYKTSTLYHFRLAFSRARARGRARAAARTMV